MYEKQDPERYNHSYAEPLRSAQTFRPIPTLPTERLVGGVSIRSSLESSSPEKLVPSYSTSIQPSGLMQQNVLFEGAATTEAVSTKSKNMTARIHDMTLKWNDSMYRIWLSEKKQLPSSSIVHLPPAKLHLSQVGFNHPNKTFGLSLMRTIRTKELLEGVVNHPWFDSENEIDRDDKTTRHYFFFDRETCKEKNYPLYGKGGIRVNEDAEGGRTTERPKDFSYRIALEDALSSLPSNAYVVVFECGGNGPKPPGLQRATRHPQLILASLSATPSQLSLPLDQGLPPPAIAHVQLTEEEKNAIKNADCAAATGNTQPESKRPILVSFMGNYRYKVRKKLKQLFHNGKDVMLPIPEEYRLSLNESMTQREAYERLLRQSRFGFVLRGDNRFSYRFSEVLSAGAIPVVLSDDWVLPFSRAVVPWEESLVRIPEASVKDTIEILKNITKKQECEMRKKAYQVYETYLKTAGGTISGIVNGMEAHFKSKALDNLSRQ